MRETVNSRTPLVIMRLYNRALSGFWIDERWTHYFTFNPAAPNIDGDMLAVLDPRMRVDQRKCNSGF